MRKSRVLAFVMAVMMTLSMVSVPADAAKKVTVKKVQVESSLSGDKKTVVVAKGKTVKLKTTVTVKPNKKANKKVTYKSANKKIATVTKAGVVKGIKKGTTTITVTSAANKKKSAKIKVQVTANPVKKVTLNTKSATMNVGETKTLKAKVTGKKGYSKKVAWTTSNAKVAAVSKKGVVTAVGAGSATIKAKAIDGSGKKATFKVTVPEAVTTPTPMPTPTPAVTQVNMVAVQVLNERTVSIALDNAMQLDISQIQVRKKVYASGTYKESLHISGMTTSDNVNYTLEMDGNSHIAEGNYVCVDIPALTGVVKSMECTYKGTTYAYVDEEISEWMVGTFASESFYFYEHCGSVGCTISGLPEGLTYKTTGSGITVKGKPTKAGKMDAVMTAEDELGNTMTKTIHFLVGDKDTIVGTACQQYALVARDGSLIYDSDSFVFLDFVGGGGSYQYTVQADPGKIVRNKWEDTATGVEYLDSDYVHTMIEDAGTYTVTIRATSTKDATKYADVTITYNVKKGIIVKGVLRDGSGEMMPKGDIRFINQNPASPYYRGDKRAGFITSSSIGTMYYVMLEPGVYNIEAKYGECDYNADSKYFYAQSLSENKSDYDIQLENLYRVDLSVDNSKYKDGFSLWDKYWYYNGEEVGYTYSNSSIYLRPGNYKLESRELWEDNPAEVKSGSWFVGETVEESQSRYTYSADVNIVNTSVSAVLCAGDKVKDVTTYKRLAAKDTPYVYDEEDDRWLDETNGYYAYSFMPLTSGEYQIDSSSYYSEVRFYDMNGTPLAKNADGYYELTAGTKYIVGTGFYAGSWFSIYKK